MLGWTGFWTCGERCLPSICSYPGIDIDDTKQVAVSTSLFSQSYLSIRLNIHTMVYFSNLGRMTSLDLLMLKVYVSALWPFSTPELTVNHSWYLIWPRQGFSADTLDVRNITESRQPTLYQDAWNDNTTPHLIDKSFIERLHTEPRSYVWTCLPVRICYDHDYVYLFEFNLVIWTRDTWNCTSLCAMPVNYSSRKQEVTEYGVRHS